MLRISFKISCKRMNVALPGLSRAGSVGALIEAVESFCQFCPKLNIQKVLLPIAENPGRENANLLMGRVMKNWKNLEREEMGKNPESILGNNNKHAALIKFLHLPFRIDEKGSGPVWWPWRSADPCCVIQPSLCCSGHQSGSALSQ